MTMMKIYNSFLIRCWLLRNTSQADRSIFEIEHIQTGERKRVASFAEMHSLMLATLASDNQPLERTSHAPDGAQENESDE